MAFVADDETAELIDPGEAALHHPSVLAATVPSFDAAAGIAGDDAAVPEVKAARRRIVTFVGVQLGGA